VAFPDFFKEFKRGVNLILVSTSKRGIGFIKIFAINSIITFTAIDSCGKLKQVHVYSGQTKGQEESTENKN
jgi:hypothetical protein